MPMTITLPQNRILSGRDAGKEARKQLNLDELDYIQSQICILISLETWSINSSFFIGCFLDSVKNLGGGILFEEKYKFLYEDIHLLCMINDGIRKCDMLVKQEVVNNVPVATNKLSRYFHL
jgi:hypothetical protein